MFSLRATLALLVVAAFTAQRVGADGATAEYSQAVQLGVDEFEQRNFLESRTHLLRAHDLYPNARTLRALGMVEFELKNYTDAASYLQQALTTQERPLDAEKRKETELLLQRASGYLARLRLEIAADTVVLVDGSRSGLRPGDQLVLPLGDHELEFQAPNRIGQRRALKIKGGEQYALRVTLVPLTESKGRSAPRDEAGGRRPVYKSPWLWTALGIVVAGAAVGTAVALARSPSTRAGPVDSGDGTRALIGPMQEQPQ